MGGGPIRSTAGARGRSRPSPGRGDRYRRRRRLGTRRAGREHDDPHRLHHRRRPGQARPSRQPQPAGRQPHGRESVHLLGAKRLELLRELVPTAAEVAVLFNPKSPEAETVSRDVEAAAHAIGLQIHVLTASRESDIDAAFASLVQRRIGALVVATDPFFTLHRDRLLALTARHRIAAVYDTREYAEAGGLMSYGTNIPDAYRLLGVYAGRVLKGEKPADLPVQQPTRFELV